MKSLLKILSDGQFHSGEYLGEQLGISRAAVWKKLKSLEDYGLEFHSVKGKGYKLVEPLVLLDEILIGKKITQLNSVLSRELQLQVLTATSSTNDVAMASISQHPGEYSVVVAEQQTKGRGRRGRQWISPFGGNVYFSLVLPFEHGAAKLDGLSLAVGVEVSKALEQLFGIKPQLKWPNDILVDGKKLGGILLEMQGDMHGLCHVVVGVGININMLTDDVIDQPWTSVRQVLNSSKPVDRSELVCDLTERLVMGLQNFDRQGFSLYKQEWVSRDAFSGLPVNVILGDSVYSGNEAGVDDSGALLLDVNGELQIFNGGEITLRRQHDS